MRPHDLLRLRPGATLQARHTPDWVGDALIAAPWVVVRRAVAAPDAIAVGVRGAQRALRHAAWLDRTDVAETVTPESLVQLQLWHGHPRAHLPAFSALECVADAAAPLGLVWGPGGSVGFELASGHATVTAESDLDVIVRPAPDHGRRELQHFADAIAASQPACRIDIVLEVDDRAVALHEWLQSPGAVLIKTPAGPALGVFSW